MPTAPQGSSVQGVHPGSRPMLSHHHLCGSTELTPRQCASSTARSGAACKGFSQEGCSWGRSSTTRLYTQCPANRLMVR